MKKKRKQAKEKRKKGKGKKGFLAESKQKVIRRNEAKTQFFSICPKERTER